MVRKKSKVAAKYWRNKRHHDPGFDEPPDPVDGAKKGKKKEPKWVGSSSSKSEEVPVKGFKGPTVKKAKDEEVIGSEKWRTSNVVYRKTPVHQPQCMNVDKKMNRVFKFNRDIWGDAPTGEEKLKPLSKPNANEAVTLPAGGLSYNPSFNDHQQHLEKVVTSEESVEKERKTLETVKKSQPNITLQQEQDEVRTAAQKFYFKGTLDSEQVEDTEQYTEESPRFQMMSNSMAKLKPIERLKKKKRRALQQMLDRRLGVKKSKEKLQKQILNSQAILEEVVKAEGESKERSEARLAVKNDPKRVRRINGALPLEPAQPFKLTQELNGSLRRMRPASSVLLNERVSSYCKRNVIEPVHTKKDKVSHGLALKHKEGRKKKYRYIFYVPRGFAH